MAMSPDPETKSNVRVTVTATAVIINLVVILILDEIYGIVALWLTELGTETKRSDKNFLSVDSVVKLYDVYTLLCECERHGECFRHSVVPSMKLWCVHAPVVPSVIPGGFKHIHIQNCWNRGKDWKHEKQENGVCVRERESDDGVCQGESTSILTYFCHSDYEFICQKKDTKSISNGLPSALVN